MGLLFHYYLKFNGELLSLPFDQINKKRHGRDQQQKVFMWLYILNKKARNGGVEKRTGHPTLLPEGFLALKISDSKLGVMLF